MIKYWILAIVCLLSLFRQDVLGQKKEYILVNNGKGAGIVFNEEEEQVVHTALSLFQQDVQSISSVELKTLSDDISSIRGNIVVGTIGRSKALAHLEQVKQIDLSGLTGKWEGFLLKSINWQGKKTLVIAGNDSRGTAYGILEVSRLIGVSPWYYFADVPLPSTKTITITDIDKLDRPSVQYRGIFINDEDWGLLPWASMTCDPEVGKGVISPKVHEHIFELLLRLRANTYWPAMHECSVPFFLIPGNREVAQKYGIHIGTSHCEPMLCNVNGEWKARGKGDYNYVTNKEGVQAFLEERVKETADGNNIYTLGMRGIHDGAMDGAKTIEEQKKVLIDILVDQREMLRKWKGDRYENTPQAFIPYKEVLDIYNQGLEVPDDVTLMWCDDNYGYIRHFPDDKEKARKGGNGVYYHISYWGRPHDYLWLATTHPALIYNQMKTAYDTGIRKMWIVNVGDIKPGEYLTELFLDMAWDIGNVNSTGVNTHLKNWFAKKFGESFSDQMASIMQEYYRLAYIRKPEFMGNTRVEERDPVYTAVRDLPWSEREIRERLKQYDDIATQVKGLSATIPLVQKDAWFQLMEYPVLAANEMNKKHLFAQLARHKKEQWKQSGAAFDSIRSLTDIYNSLKGGKWKRMMDYQPRRLAVFQPVPLDVKESMVLDTKSLAVLNGMEYSSHQGSAIWAQGLGYGNKAVALGKQSRVTYDFKAANRESISFEIRLVPNHPVNGDRLRISVSVDNNMEIPLGYETKGRSEEWKMNVLRNQAIRRLVLPINSGEDHTLSITALDEGVIIDQVVIE